MLAQDAKPFLSIDPAGFFVGEINGEVPSQLSYMVIMLMLNFTLLEKSSVVKTMGFLSLTMP